MKKKLESFLSIIATIFVALLIRTLVFEPFSIPSSSMNPNFLIGDYLFVSKYSYGISNTSILLEPNLIKGRVLDINKPQRGDVIVFKPEHEHFAGFMDRIFGVNYIKRLVGLPGDEIQVKDGILYINGQMIPRKPAGTFTDAEGNILKRYIETLPSNVSYYVVEDDRGSMADNTPVYKVPEGHYFFMGDNRDHSADSRFGKYPVGYVPYDKLVGKAEIIVFSDPASLLNLPKWILEFKTDRIFKRVKPLEETH